MSSLKHVISKYWLITLMFTQNTGPIRYLDRAVCLLKASLSFIKRLLFFLFFSLSLLLISRMASQSHSNYRPRIVFSHIKLSLWHNAYVITRIARSAPHASHFIFHFFFLRFDFQIAYLPTFSLHKPLWFSRTSSHIRVIITHRFDV